jgi:hypothetical protein
MEELSPHSIRYYGAGEMPFQFFCFIRVKELFADLTLSLNTQLRHESFFDLFGRQYLHPLLRIANVLTLPVMGKLGRGIVFAADRYNFIAFLRIVSPVLAPVIQLHG